MYRIISIGGVFLADFSFSIFPDHNFVDCTLFQYGWEQCDPLHSFGPAARNHYLFHYIISGKGRLMSTPGNGQTREYALHEGQGFLISPGQTNTYIADEHNPWRYVWLEFDGLKAAEFVTLAGLSFDSPIYNSNNPIMQKNLQEEMLYVANHVTESPLNLIGHLYLALDAMIKSSSQRMTEAGGKLKDFYAREAIGYIERNYQNDITIEDISRFCSLNRSYFGKIFKDVLSVTPQEFLIRYRMAKACEYLETTGLSVGDISARVGYPSQLHFSRAFKKVYGVAPREWRMANMHKPASED